MIFRAPIYYKDFHCIANKCKDSCCSAGWEIDIDEKTSEFYKNVSGIFGDKLKRSISKTTPPHFVLNKEGKCPFLNDKKLCDIYINLGENHLCQICKDHPRFYEWFDGVTEAGIGLCCEEAARIILTQSSAFSTYETEIDSDISFAYNSETNYNIDLYDYLVNARKKIITYLDNDSQPIEVKLRNILWYGHTLQQNIDNDLLDDEEIFDVTGNSISDIEPIIKFFSSLEPNNENWPEYLKHCCQLYKESSEQLKHFEQLHPEINDYLKNIAIYFIWRYLLKGVFDYDILSKIKLMFISIVILRCLLFCCWIENGKLNFEDCVDIVKKFSEEVEYSEDNLETFAENSYKLEIFMSEYLLGML